MAYPMSRDSLEILGSNTTTDTSERRSDTLERQGETTEETEIDMQIGSMLVEALNQSNACSQEQPLAEVTYVGNMLSEEEESEEEYGFQGEDEFGHQEGQYPSEEDCFQEEEEFEYQHQFDDEYDCYCSDNGDDSEEDDNEDDSEEDDNEDNSEEDDNEDNSEEAVIEYEEAMSEDFYSSCDESEEDSDFIVPNGFNADGTLQGGQEYGFQGEEQEYDFQGEDEYGHCEGQYESEDDYDDY